MYNKSVIIKTKNMEEMPMTNEEKILKVRVDATMQTDLENAYERLREVEEKIQTLKDNKEKTQSVEAELELLEKIKKDTEDSIEMWKGKIEGKEDIEA